PAGHRRELDDLARARRELRCATLDRIFHAARYAEVANWFALPVAVLHEDVARSDQRAQDFLDEERIALGQAVQQIEELAAARACAMKDRAQHGIEIAATQTLQPQLDRQALPIERRQQATQAIVDLVAAKGEDEQQALLRGGAGQRPHQLEAGFISPVNVLDHYEQRALARGTSKAVRDRLEQAAFVLFGIHPRRGLDKFRQQFPHEP